MQGARASPTPSRNTNGVPLELSNTLPFDLSRPTYRICTRLPGGRKRKAALRRAHAQAQRADRTATGALAARVSRVSCASRASRIGRVSTAARALLGIYAFKLRGRRQRASGARSEAPSQQVRKTHSGQKWRKYGDRKMGEMCTMNAQKLRRRA